MKVVLKSHESRRKLNSTELKKAQIEILEKFARVCEKENLQFMLYYGSLLGAVRHKGFIPWDDDIDLCMERTSYDKLFAINWSTENLKLISSVNRDDAPYPFSKISSADTLFLELQNHPVTDLGINIDIFPLDYIPESRLRRGVENLLLKMLKTVLMARLVKARPERSTLKNGILKSANFCFSLLSPRALAKAINALASNADRPSPMTGCRVGPYGTKDCFSTEDFRHVEKMSFEDSIMPVPAGHDAILTRLYGDYMTPPPEQDRSSHHQFEAYIKDPNAGESP